MKALTLHQPWAQLIALGVKTIETRTKPTKYRGELLIHAGAAEPPSGYQYGDYEVPGLQMFHNGGYVPKMVRLTDYTDIPLPLGAIVASCNLVDVVPIVGQDDDMPESACIEVSPTISLLWGSVTIVGKEDVYGPREEDTRLVIAEVTDQLPYGDLTPGRFAWLLEDIQPTTERCPACWGTGVDQFHAEYCDSDPCFHDWNCATCKGKGTCDPIPARGRQGLWEWTP